MITPFSTINVGWGRLEPERARTGKRALSAEARRGLRRSTQLNYVRGPRRPVNGDTESPVVVDASRVCAVQFSSVQWLSTATARVAIRVR